MIDNIIPVSIALQKLSSNFMFETTFLVVVNGKKESTVANYFTKMAKMIPWRVFMSFYWTQDQEEILLMLQSVYVSGVVAWLLNIFLGPSAAMIEYHVTCYHNNTPET